MTARVELQPAYVLHSRPYQDSSLIVHFITHDWGRVSAVSKGGRKGKKNTFQRLQPFKPLIITYQGQANLKNLLSVEASGVSHNLNGNHLFSGFYANELLMRLLPEHDPSPKIYELYNQILSALAGKNALEPVLRYFEFNLLELLGYGISLEYEATTGESLNAGCHYVYSPDDGFIVSEITRGENRFSGQDLIAIREGQWENSHIRQVAKRLTRLALRPHLGSRPLKSRELFTHRYLRNQTGD